MPHDTNLAVTRFADSVGSAVVFEMKASSFSKIYLKNTESGQPIRDALYKHIQDVLELSTTVKESVSGKNVVVFDIPRGGVPSADAAFDYFQNSTSAASIQHISSQLKTLPDNLFPENMNFANTDTLIIVDAVVATGKTICDHLDQVPDSFTGKVILLSNATAEKGVCAFNDSLNANGLSGFHVTGGIIADKDCIMKVIDGKQVYIVGLGDIGDAVSVDPIAKSAQPMKTRKVVPGGQ